MLDDWPRAFPGCEAVAYRMKHRFPDRWVRFHSLPESKRYPDDEDEFAIVLARQNRVLGELFGSESQGVLLTTRYEAIDGVEVSHDEQVLREIDPDAKPWLTLAMHELDENFSDRTYWQVFASQWTWRPGVFDPILRRIALDEIANIMILPPDCGWLFHPYDGGMDLILESSAARDRIKAAHSGWLSSHPDGL